MVLSKNIRTTQTQNTAFLKDFLYVAAVENDLLPLAWLDHTQQFLFASPSFHNTLGITGETAWKKLTLEALPAPASTIMSEVISHVTHSQKNKFEFYTKTSTNSSATIKVVKFGGPQHFDGAMITVAGGIRKPKPNSVSEYSEKCAHSSPNQYDTISGPQLTTLLSHELREPLRTIGNFSHLLDQRCSGQLDESGKEYLQFVRSGVAQLDSLFNDMLDMVQIDELHLQKKEIRTTDIETILTAAYSKRLVDLNGQFAFKSTIHSFRACPNKILSLFTHLLDNALKFRSPERSPIIVVKLTDGGDSWLIDVEDNGIGIPEEYHKRIFMPFKRLHTRTTYPGNGAGLAICKKIVELHKGTIWVTANDGQGSCFHFTLKK